MAGTGQVVKGHQALYQLTRRLTGGLAAHGGGFGKNLFKTGILCPIGYKDTKYAIEDSKIKLGQDYGLPANSQRDHIVRPRHPE